MLCPHRAKKKRDGALRLQGKKKTQNKPQLPGMRRKAAGRQSPHFRAQSFAKTSGGEKPGNSLPSSKMQNFHSLFLNRFLVLSFGGQSSCFPGAAGFFAGFVFLGEKGPCVHFQTSPHHLEKDLFIQHLVPVCYVLGTF